MACLNLYKTNVEDITVFLTFAFSLCINKGWLSMMQNQTLVNRDVKDYRSHVDLCHVESENIFAQRLVQFVTHNLSANKMFSIKKWDVEAV